VPLSFGCGLLMGGADAVPGVSGGTIALIVGVYERFVESLHVALRLPWLVGSPAGPKP
jgi:putative membrane protein